MPCRWYSAARWLARGAGLGTRPRWGFATPDVARPTAIDLFAGAGGSTAGLRAAGFDVLAAVENDRWAAESYRLNHEDVLLYEEDIRTVDPGEMRSALRIAPADLWLTVACPPCQGWSTLGSGDAEDPRNGLVDSLLPFIREFLPRAFLIENVPGLARDPRLGHLRDGARELGYSTVAHFADATQFGVPQRRRRLIVVGARGVPGRRMPRALPGTWIRRSGPQVAEDAFSRLAAVEDGDTLSVGRTLRPTTVRRIAAIPVGGNRFDLPPELQLDCHQTVARSASGPYGRIRLHEPAPTMTTRCTTPSCGQFVHPTENRGLTLREAALIQTFPPDYQFAGTYAAKESQIGNAVPVTMAAGLARVALSVLERAVRPG